MGGPFEQLEPSFLGKPTYLSKATWVRTQDLTYSQARALSVAGPGFELRGHEPKSCFCIRAFAKEVSKKASGQRERVAFLSFSISIVLYLFIASKAQRHFLRVSKR